MPIRQALARSAQLHKLSQEHNREHSARSQTLVSLRVRPTLDQVEVLLPVSLIAALLLQQRGPQWGPSATSPVPTGTGATWTDPNGTPPEDETARNVPDVERDLEEESDTEEPCPPELPAYHEDFDIPAAPGSFASLQVLEEAMRQDIIWWCRKAIQDGEGLPSCWEQFPYHNIAAFSFTVLASPVINLHEDDELAGTPAALLELMHTTVECHLAAGETPTRPIRDNDCHGIAVMILGNVHGGNLGDMLMEKVWLPTPMKAHRLFFQFLDEGCPRSMYQELRQYAGRHRPQKGPRYSEPHPSTPTRSTPRQSHWHGPAAWRASRAPAAEWSEGRTWTPSSSSGQQAYARTWSSNRSAHPRDESWDEL